LPGCLLALPCRVTWRNLTISPRFWPQIVDFRLRGARMPSGPRTTSPRHRSLSLSLSISFPISILISLYSNISLSRSHSYLSPSLPPLPLHSSFLLLPPFLRPPSPPPPPFSAQRQARRAGQAAGEGWVGPQGAAARSSRPPKPLSPLRAARAGRKSGQKPTSGEGFLAQGARKPRGSRAEAGPAQTRWREGGEGRATWSGRKGRRTARRSAAPCRAWPLARGAQECHA
jgi:hypothetical protein